MNRFITLLLLGVVGVAMLLVFFVHMKDTESDPPVPTSQSIPVDPAPAPPAPMRPQTPQAAPVVEAAPQAPTPPAAPPTPPAAPQTPAKPQPAEQPAPSKPQTPAKPAAKPQAVTTPSPQTQQPAKPQTPATASVALGAGTIVDMSLHFKDKGMVLRIEGNGPLPARYFVLKGPERLVVDLPGTWKGLKKPTIPSNYLVKDLRIGRHGNADRLVLDMLEPLGDSSMTRLGDNKVEIYFAK